MALAIRLSPRAFYDLEEIRDHLIERSPQGVEPTRYGEALVRRGGAVFNELSQGIKEIEGVAHKQALRGGREPSRFQHGGRHSAGALG